MQNPRNIPLITVFEKLPMHGGKPETISIETFEKKFHCTYRENVFYDIQLESSLHAYEAKPDVEYAVSDLQKSTTAVMKNPRRDLAIVNLGDPVGYGVMALNDIKEGEVLAVYAGEIIRTDSPEAVDNVYLYNIKNSNLGVSSATSGNISRFLSHMPVDHMRKQEKLMRTWNNIDSLAKVLSSKFNVTLQQCKQILMAKKQSNPAAFAAFIEENVEFTTAIDAPLDREFATIEFSDPTLRSRVATSNVTVKLVKIANIPYVVMIADYDIKKHEVLGFSYGPHFWQTTGCPPSLMHKDGRIIDSTQYKIKHFTFTFNLNSGIFELPLTQKECLDDIDNQKPLELVINDKTSEFYSVHQFRDKAVQANMIDHRYQHTDQNSFSVFLDNTLNATVHPPLIKNYTVLNYFHQPEGNKNAIDNYTVDTVIQAKDSESYEALLTFLAPVSKRTNVFHKTLEAVIESTNVNDNSNDPNKNINAFMRG